MSRHTLTVVLGISFLFLTGCSKAYYGMWEKFGYEKRDLLVGEVEDAKESQEKAKEQFKTTLQRFQEVTNFQGGELEAKYKKLNTEYERCKSRAEAVTAQVEDVDEVAQAMFREWKQERHRVLIQDDGYHYRDRRYGSLSQIATKITGVRWSGPRFFGLRRPYGKAAEATENHDG